MIFHYRFGWFCAVQFNKSFTQHWIIAHTIYTKHTVNHDEYSQNIHAFKYFVLAFKKFVLAFKQLVHVLDFNKFCSSFQTFGEPWIKSTFHNIIKQMCSKMLWRQKQTWIGQTKLTWSVKCLAVITSLDGLMHALCCTTDNRNLRLKVNLKL